MQKAYICEALWCVTFINVIIVGFIFTFMSQIRLDLLDRRILTELDIDATLSFADLATRTRCSLQTARNRLSRLEEEGAIIKFYTAIDSARLGLEMFEFYIKFRPTDSKTIQKAIGYLQNQNAVTWIGGFSGAFDVGSALRVRRPVELADVINGFLVKFGNVIAKKNIQLNVAMEYLPRSYLTRRSRSLRRLKHLEEGVPPIELDEVDREILVELGNNARLGPTELSRRLSKKKINLTREAISLRIAKMRKHGPINGATIVINHSVINQHHYKVLICLNSSALEELDRFLNAARAEANVVYIVRTLGEWDLELDIEVEHPDEFRNVLAKLSQLSPKLIRDYLTVEINSIYKYSISETIKEPSISRSQSRST